MVSVCSVFSLWGVHFLFLWHLLFFFYFYKNIKSHYQNYVLTPQDDLMQNVELSWTKLHEYGEMKKINRYLLFPPHLSSPFLLPLCLLQFWLSLLSWSWLRFFGLLRLHPPSRRTPRRTLSSCRECGLKVRKTGVKLKRTPGSEGFLIRTWKGFFTGYAFVGVLLILISAVLLHCIFRDRLHLNTWGVGQHAQILKQALPRGHRDIWHATKDETCSNWTLT